jgi:hypothetical protein
VNGSFDAETLQVLDETREAQIETRRDEDAPVHRTIIWVVTVDGEVYVRSVRGEKGRWYHFRDRRIPVRAVPVRGEPTVGAVSEAYRDKYGRTSPGSTRAMLQPETLPTTLKLEPA